MRLKGSSFRFEQVLVERTRHVAGVRVEWTAVQHQPDRFIGALQIAGPVEVERQHGDDLVRIAPDRGRIQDLLDGRRKIRKLNDLLITKNRLEEHPQRLLPAGQAHIRFFHFLIYTRRKGQHARRKRGPVQTHRAEFSEVEELFDAVIRVGQEIIHTHSQEVRKRDPDRLERERRIAVLDQAEHPGDRLDKEPDVAEDEIVAVHLRCSILARMILKENTQLEPGPHTLPGGIEIAADAVTLDGRGARLAGVRGEGVGIRIDGRRGVVIKNLDLAGYRHGISITGSQDIRLENVRVAGTAEIPHSTVFLDIFHRPGDYGGGVLVRSSGDVMLERCNLSHQMCGLLSYDSRELTVRGSAANYCSGFGFYLSGTTVSLFESNHADFCCRWQPRGDGGGHMGADAAGFVLVRGSSRNTFRGNFARMGGDGFFLAGLTHDRIPLPCNDNRFFENDASWSPNIGFEATFSSGNLFQDNIAEQCNYGFWLGFSRDNLLEGNRIRYNRQAGIAVENGVRMTAKRNRISHNGYGILLWSKRIPAFDDAVPENDTSRDWTIEDNEFSANGSAVRLAADQDHGVAPFTDHGPCPPLGLHFISGNTFTRNRIDLDVPEGFGAGS